MQRNAAVTGLIGLVLLIFGLVDYFIAPNFTLFVYVNLVGGLVAIVAYLVSSRGTLTSLAGLRSTRYGANAVIYTAAFVGVLTAVNYLSTRFHTRADLTAENVYSLSSQSVNIVKGLKQPLKFYGFVPGGEAPGARLLYETYKYAAPDKISFELVDPDKHPELAEKFKVSVMNTTHLQYGGDDGQGANVTELSEEALTNAIIRTTQATRKTVAFLDGHGEPDPDDATDPGAYGSFKQSLEGDGFAVTKLLLATEANVPAGVNVLIIGGPVKPLLQHELDQVKAFVNRGGRVLVMFRAPRPDNSIDEKGLAALVDGWGVKVGDNVVVDQVVRLFAGPALGLNPLVQSYGEHPITRNFNQRTLFPMARSLQISDQPKAGLELVALARTSDTSWAETDIEGIFKRQEAKLDAGDVRGPVTVAAAIRANLEALNWGRGGARMVVLGSADVIDNQYISNFFNRDFVVNSVNWLAGEEGGISIRPRGLRASRFRLTVDQFQIVFALSVLLLPELLLIAGIAVWWSRRH
ncbi:MAG: GldG family protein [Candidatus Binataceae bacterium]